MIIGCTTIGKLWPESRKNPIYSSSEAEFHEISEYLSFMKIGQKLAKLEVFKV